jgi:hypothetical protein
MVMNHRQRRHNVDVKVAPAPVPAYLIVIRWIARLTSLGTIAVIAAFAFGEGTPSGQDWLLLVFFPIGLLVGLVLAWRNELLGGAVALGSMLAFCAVVFAASGRMPTGPYFAVLAAPAALFLVSGLLARRAAAR